MPTGGQRVPPGTAPVCAGKPGCTLPGVKPEPCGELQGRCGGADKVGRAGSGAEAAERAGHAARTHGSACSQDAGRDPAPVAARCARWAGKGCARALCHALKPEESQILL